jgi:hypothetical protein
MILNLVDKTDIEKPELLTLDTFTEDGCYPVISDTEADDTKYAIVCRNSGSAILIDSLGDITIVYIPEMENTILLNPNTVEVALTLK